MNHLLVQPHGAGWRWRRFDASGRPAAAADSGESPPTSDCVILLVPAWQAHCAALELPDTSSTKLRRAAPFALEEHLAGDVERLHIAVGERLEDGRLLAAAIDPETLRGYLDALREFGIEPEAALPDALCLPWRDGRITLLNDGDMALLRHGPGAATSLETDRVPALLEALATEPAPLMECYGEPPRAWPGELRRHQAPEPLELLAPGALQAPINLLQGDFSPRTRRHTAPLWYAAAAAAGIWWLGSMGYALTEWWLLDKRVATLDTEIRAIFQETFPDAGPMVRPRVQAERRLRALTTGGATSFLGSLGHAAPVLEATENLTVDSLEYDRRGLRLRMRMTSIGQLDGLTQRLRKRGLEARIEGASRDAEGVTATLMIATGAEP